jgi:hypothetical protein
VIAPLYSADYHPSHPVENLRSLWSDYAYRTKYGSGSGWGYFKIDATNNYIDFNDGSVRAANLTIGDYDGDSLASHIAARMTAVGGQTYTCVYSNTTNKFTISASGTFSILWSTGSHHSTTVGEHIGFYISQDDTGTNTYTADYVRSHNYGGFQIDSWDGSSIATTGCVLIGLNLTSSYQILRLERWYNSVWESIGDLTYSSTDGRAYIFYAPKSATKYRVVARDWTNPDKYLEFGVPILGGYVDLSRGYEYGATVTHDDTSQKAYSKHGYLNIVVGFEQVVRAVQYEVMTADETKIDTFWDSVMERYPFVFIGDSAVPFSDMTYAILRAGIEKTRLDEYFQKVTMVWEKVL